jgi:CubicO group peptidase (beta-lactamase class C family)
LERSFRRDVATSIVAGPIGRLAVTLAILPFGGLAAGKDAPRPLPAPRTLNELLEPIRAKHKLPALAAAVVATEGIQAIGATGVRRAGHDEPVTINDLWHLGSCTKAMTATLVARLVEQGKLRWTTSLGETFPELKKTMDPAWPAVTLEQLLRNRGGAPQDSVLGDLYEQLRQHKGTPSQARRLLLERVLKHAPDYPPGSKMQYSNANFVIAGHVAEVVVGVPWEDLIRREVFEPLGITSAGFGAPGHAGGGADEPWGHEAGKPVVPGPDADNPVVIGPAGNVHMSLGDWGRFIRAHLLAARGEPVTGMEAKPLLTPESWRKLHAAPADGDYAMGWMVLTRPWAKGDRPGDSGYVLTHKGSNTLWFCVTWLAPERGFAVLVTSNIGDEEAEKGTDEAAFAVIQDWLKR